MGHAHVSSPWGPCSSPWGRFAIQALSPLPFHVLVCVGSSSQLFFFFFLLMPFWPEARSSALKGWWHRAQALLLSSFQAEAMGQFLL